MKEEKDLEYEIINILNKSGFVHLNDRYILNLNDNIYEIRIKTNLPSIFRDQKYSLFIQMGEESSHQSTSGEVILQWLKENF